MNAAPLVYGAYTQPELDAQYDTALPAREDVARYLERFAAASAAARDRCVPQMLRYGPHPREVLDFFAAPHPGAPLFFWIHGGYWRRMSKDVFSFVVPPLVRAGAAVAIPSYPLAPEASLGQIVASLTRAYEAVVAHAYRFDADPGRVVAGGHSAGGQLAGMLAAAVSPLGVFAISGLYDLEPVRRSKINETIAMDTDDVQRYSPLLHVPERPGTLTLATGALEQPEFHRQHDAYARAWRAASGTVREIAAPGHDHFSIVLELEDVDSALTRALIEQLAPTV